MNDTWEQKKHPDGGFDEDFVVMATPCEYFDDSQFTDGVAFHVGNNGGWHSYDEWPSENVIYIKRDFSKPLQHHKNLLLKNYLRAKKIKKSFCKSEIMFTKTKIYGG